MLNNPLISIIIPVFNAEKTLKNTLLSISAQSYPSIEIVIVNDCSTDNSKVIINEFLQNPPKNLIIKYIEPKMNKGVASARNIGLQNCTGEYIYYVDADDTLEDDAIELMAKEAVENDLDIVGCECYLSLNENRRWLKQAHASTPSEAFEAMSNDKMKWNLWLFMVKREIYLNNNITFIDGVNIGEDLMVMGKILFSSKNISIIHRPLYNYNVVNSQSISKEKKNQYFEDVSRNLMELEHFAKKTGKPYKNQFINLKLTLKFPLLMSDKINDYQKWQNWFPEVNKFIKDNNSITKRNKIIQLQALRKNYLFLKMYNKLIFRFIYGVLYK